jgi:hypothetical protein
MPAVPESLITAFAAAPLAAVPMVVGGIACTGGITAQSLGVLRGAPGLMIRQPLMKAGSPLARCDYHSVAAPYRPFFTALEATGRRGAAGRHIAKLAFCQALIVMLRAIQEDPWAAWEAMADRAWAAFGADVGYASQIASAGFAATPLAVAV